MATHPAAGKTTKAATGADAAGLTATLEYDAFISYRRGDAAWHARALRQRLLDIRIPAGVASAAHDRRLQIYLDHIYERATDDFFEQTIKPALRASRHLIVVVSRSSTEASPDGSPNWQVREIEYFRSLPPDGRSISVAVAAGEMTGPLPGRLHETHPNIERIDLRRRRWLRPAAFDDRLLTLAAALHDIRPADMPALRREDVRRRRSQTRRRRLLSGIAAGTLLIAMTAGIWQYMRAREAVAASLWNRLDFSTKNALTPDELNALWEIRAADAGLREALLAELMKNGNRASRMGRAPAPIMRALFLRWPDQTIARVFTAVVTAARTSDPSELEALWRTSEALARELPVEAVPAALDAVLAATTGRTEVLAFPTLQILADKLTPAAAPPAFDVVLRRMEATADVAASRHYWAAARAFGVGATPDQAGRTLALALRAADRTTEPDDLEMLARAVGAFPGRLSAPEAERLLAPLTKAIAETTWALQGLGQAVEAMANRLPPEQARRVAALLLGKLDGGDPFAAAGLCAALAALAPALDSTEAGRALDRLMREAGRGSLLHAVHPLADAMVATAARLTSEQASAALPPLLAALSEKPFEALEQPEIDRVVEAVAGRLTPPLARASVIAMAASIDPRPLQSSTESLEALRQRLLDGLLGKFPGYREPAAASALTAPAGGAPAAGVPAYDARVLRPAVTALSGALTAPEIDGVVSRLLHSLGDTPAPRSVYAVAAMAGPMADRLGAAQRQTAVAQVMRQIEGTTRPDALLSLASLAAALRGQLVLPQVTPMLRRLLEIETGDLFAAVSPNQAFRLLSAAVPPGDTAALLPLVLQRIESEGDVGSVYFVAEALRGWLASGVLTEPQTREVVETALRAMARTTDDQRLETLVALIVQAPGRLDPGQTQIVMKSLLGEARSEPDVPGLTEPRATLARALRAAAPKLTDEQRNAAAAAVQSDLAWSNTERKSRATAEALVALNAGAPREAYARAMVEALKYPAAAGPATEILLAALRRVLPQAPGTEGGLQAMLAWIAREFPDIDLHAVPRCPPPREPGQACPPARFL